MVWPCSRDYPINLSVFQSTDHDFIVTPSPTNLDEIFGASIHLSTRDGGDRPWVVPILNPPDGWEADFNGLQDHTVRPDMRWQVGGAAVDNTVVKYRLPDARQPASTPIPEWPEIIAAYDHGIVTVEKFEQLGKDNCWQSTRWIGPILA